VCKPCQPSVCKPCQPSVCKPCNIDSITDSGTTTEDPPFNPRYFSKYKSSNTTGITISDMTPQPISTTSTTSNICIGTLPNPNSATIYGTTLQPASTTFP
jgi:hypothetical protein